MKFFLLLSRFSSVFCFDAWVQHWTINKYLLPTKQNAQPCKLICEKRQTFYEITCDRRFRYPLRAIGLQPSKGHPRKRSSWIITTIWPYSMMDSTHDLSDHHKQKSIAKDELSSPDVSLCGTIWKCLISWSTMDQIGFSDPFQFA